MIRTRRLKMVALAGTGILAIAVAAVWTYGSGERTYYGPHTGILHTGDTVVVAEDFSVPGSTAVRTSTRGIVQSDPAWDEDSCDPLQVPDKIGNNDQLLQYFKDWRPTYEPGTYRTYSNLTIGTLGLITAKSMGEDFVELVEQRLFPALGMKSSYINIPKGKMADYAQGYTKENTRIRMTTGVLAFETYGIRATAADMIRFVEANMNEIEVDEKLRRAIRATHTGYFKVGSMTQDLIWEQYPYPVTLKTLLDGNAPEIIFNATPVTQLNPPEQPRDDVWINKTGSTNGFGAYVAFIPEKRLGIVILASKNYPIADRVTAAYQILISLEGGSGQLR